MSQPTFVLGLTTHTLPYPQTYQMSTVLRSADFTSYAGTVRRDYTAGVDKTIHYVQMGWSSLSNAEMILINNLWRAMAENFIGWTYTDPAGTVYNAHINPEAPNLATTRYSAGDGAVLYTARLNLILEL